MHRGSRSSWLNHFFVRLPVQVVLTKRARGLDLFDEHAYSYLQTQVVPTPANSTGKLPNQTSMKRGQSSPRTARRMRAHPFALLLKHSVRSAPRLRALSVRIAPQKENQCQES